MLLSKSPPQKTGAGSLEEPRKGHEIHTSELLHQLGKKLGYLSTKCSWWGERRVGCLSLGTSCQPCNRTGFSGCKWKLGLIYRRGGAKDTWAGICYKLPTKIHHFSWAESWSWSLFLPPGMGLILNKYVIIHWIRKPNHSELITGLAVLFYQK